MNQQPHGWRAGVARLRRAGPLIAWTLTLVTAVAAFHTVGSGPLTPPPLTDPSGWTAWADQRTPLEAIAAVARLIVLLLAWYLLGVTTVGAVARLVRSARLVGLADRLTAPPVRLILQHGLGIGLAGAMAVGATTHAGLQRPPVAEGPAAGAPVAAGTSPEAPVTPWGEPPPTPRGPIRPAAAPPTAAPPVATPPAAAPPAAAPPAATPPARTTPAEVLPGARAPAPPESTPSPEPTEPDPSEPDASEPAPARAPRAPADTHEVAPGEHLWAVAEQALTRAWGRAPSDGELGGYWWQVVETNRDRLPDRDNPDLIYPGQLVELPPTPRAPS